MTRLATRLAPFSTRAVRTRLAVGQRHESWVIDATRHAVSARSDLLAAAGGCIHPGAQLAASSSVREPAGNQASPRCWSMLVKGTCTKFVGPLRTFPTYRPLSEVVASSPCVAGAMSERPVRNSHAQPMALPGGAAVRITHGDAR